MTESQISDSLCARLSAIGIPNRVKIPIVNEVGKWVTCSGPQWTVDRLKAMKQDLVLSWGGLPPTSEGIAYRSGAPKGPFRPLWEMTSGRGKIKALSTLMIYTHFLAPRVTDKQLDKFVTSVVRSAAKLDGQELRKEELVLLSRASVYVNNITTLGLKYHTITGFYPEINFDRYPWSPTRRAPTLSGKTRPERTDRDSPLDHVLLMSRKSDRFVELLVKYECLQQALPKDFRDQIMDHAEDSMLWRRKGLKLSSSSEIDNVGRISFIQEPGYKLRAVANPLRVYQVALRPLKYQLDSILECMPWSATHDQKQGVLDVQSALQKGHTIHALDLSDATNNFPLSIQMELLRRLEHIDQDHVSLFYDVSRSNWLLPERSGGFRAIQWNVGQPLGLAPSSAAFSLTHGMVIMVMDNAIWKKEHGTKPYEPRFRTIGDDVAIWNDQLAGSYVRWLEQWEIPISLTKSTTSDRVTEFAGKVITPDRVFPQLKWKDPSNNSFVDIARNLGPQSFSLFTRRQRVILELIKEVPTEVGGLGWNPLGKTYDERMASPIAQLMASDEKYTFLERGLSGPNLTRYSSEYLHEFEPTGINPVQNQFGTGKKTTKEMIHDSTNVIREKFLDSEIVGPEWRNPTQVSDPRGPSVASVLGRKFESMDEVPQAIAEFRRIRQSDQTDSLRSRRTRPKGFEHEH